MGKLVQATTMAFAVSQTLLPFVVVNLALITFLLLSCTANETTDHAGLSRQGAHVRGPPGCAGLARLPWR